MRRIRLQHIDAEVMEQYNNVYHQSRRGSLLLTSQPGPDDFLGQMCVALNRVNKGTYDLDSVKIWDVEMVAWTMYG